MSLWAKQEIIVQQYGFSYETKSKYYLYLFFKTRFMELDLKLHESTSCSVRSVLFVPQRSKQSPKLLSNSKKGGKRPTVLSEQHPLVLSRYKEMAFL